MSSTPATQLESATASRSARSHARMHFLMLIATVCWAVNIVAGKKALLGFAPLALAMLRVSGAAVVFAALFLAWRKPLPVPTTAREWLLLLGVSLSGVSLNQILFIGGLARSSVSHAGLLVALGPVMVLVLSVLLRLEALTVPKFAGMMISFVGVAVLTMDKVGQGNGSHWKGDLVLLAASAVFAVYTILVKEVSDRYDALTLNTLTYGLGVPLMIPVITLSVSAVRWEQVPALSWWGLAYMVVLGSVVPYLIFAFAMTELAPSRVAAFSYLQPIIATSLGIWIVGEKLTWRLLTGGALILLGVYLTERERGEEKQAV